MKYTKAIGHEIWPIKSQKSNWPFLRNPIFLNERPVECVPRNLIDLHSLVFSDSIHMLVLKLWPEHFFLCKFSLPVTKPCSEFVKRTPGKFQEPCIMAFHFPQVLYQSYNIHFNIPMIPKSLALSQSLH